uniref:Uncharacterized protein n=1 Tax=Pavo cristatus TaxID=9049 RepID=A0A8C9FRU7_PAVCR
MKLLTHNLLTSHVRGLQPGAGFPFHIRASEVRVRSVPFNAAFVARLLPRLHWEALLTNGATAPQLTLAPRTVAQLILATVNCGGDSLTARLTPGSA